MKHKIMIKGISVIIKRLIICVLVSLICLTLLSPRRTRADAVTDTLTVYVGYAGMDLSQYVQAGHYHWSELMNALPLYEEAYSYFQSNLVGNGYTAIVDSARGFYISDILSYSNIYVGDIYNLMFYVMDSQGIRSSFDYYELFRTRYYFDNVAGHRQIKYGTKTVEKEVTKEVPREVETEVETLVPQEVEKEVEVEVPVLDEEGNPVLDEDGNPVTEIEVQTAIVTEYVTEIITVTETVYDIVTEKVTEIVPDYSKVEGYTFDECWGYCHEVLPMLAIEDNWASFNEEFENIGPDFSYANAGNRFRLLFGQTSPTESLTSKSDKYVSRMYVTLYGSPVIGGDMEDGTAKYGANTVELEVSEIYNQDMTDMLSEYLDVRSTDENVIEIESIETISDSIYSDKAKVIIHYRVNNDGVASFSIGIGSYGDKNVFSGKADIVVKDGKATFTKDGIAPDNPGNTADQEKETGIDDPISGDGTEGRNGEQVNNTSGNISSDSGNVSEGGQSGGSQNGQQMSNPEEGRTAVGIVGAELENVADEAIGLETGGGLYGLYQLSDEFTEKLSGSALVYGEPTKASVEITQVKMKDNSDEKEEQRKLILILTGVGFVLIAVFGAIFEYVNFRLRLGKNILKTLRG